MYHIDFNNPVHVHFIGIGGISMSGLAHILIGRLLPYPAPTATNLNLQMHLKRKAAHAFTSRGF